MLDSIKQFFSSLTLEGLLAKITVIWNAVTSLLTIFSNKKSDKPNDSKDNSKEEAKK